MRANAQAEFLWLRHAVKWIRNTNTNTDTNTNTNTNTYEGECTGRVLVARSRCEMD